MNIHSGALIDSSVAGATGLGPVATLLLAPTCVAGFRFLVKPIDIPEWEQPCAQRLAMQSVSPILIAALRAGKTIRVFPHI
jgi:hypothetical protein